MRLSKMQKVAVNALEEIKGQDILVLDVRKLTTMCDTMIIASAQSTRQVKALADNVQDKVRENGARVYGVEGEQSGEWVLVDLGDVVVHIMHPTVREFYNLEEIWGGKPVRLNSPKKKARPRAAPSRRRRKR